MEGRSHYGLSLAATSVSQIDSKTMATRAICKHDNEGHVVYFICVETNLV